MELNKLYKHKQLEIYIVPISKLPNNRYEVKLLETRNIEPEICTIYISSCFEIYNRKKTVGQTYRNIDTQLTVLCTEDYNEHFKGVVLNNTNEFRLGENSIFKNHLFYPFPVYFGLGNNNLPLKLVDVIKGNEGDFATITEDGATCWMPLQSNKNDILKKEDNEFIWTNLNNFSFEELINALTFKWRENEKRHKQ